MDLLMHTTSPLPRAGEQVDALAFLLDRMSTPDGRTCSELRRFSQADFMQFAEAFDWLFPADRYAQPGSKAPSVSRDELQQLAEDEQALAAFRANYSAVLITFDLVVDQHAWVFGKTTGNFDWMRTPSVLDVGFARVIRHLTLLGVCGTSRSGGYDPDGNSFSYAGGLQVGLSRLARKYREQQSGDVAWLWKKASFLMPKGP